MHSDSRIAKLSSHLGIAAVVLLLQPVFAAFLGLLPRAHSAGECPWCWCASFFATQHAAIPGPPH